MFGWRRRSEGFEWREYVRTTVLVRRADRQRRVEEVRAAAVEKVKHARVAGADAGRASISYAGSQLSKFLAAVGSALLDILVAAFHGASKWLKFGFAVLADALGGVARPLIDAARVPANAAREKVKAMPDVARGLPIKSQHVLGAAAVLGLIFLGGPMLRSADGVAVATISPEAQHISAELSGRATAVTGDMLRVDGTLVRLDGVEAPAAGQPCYRPDGRRWGCAAAARTGLSRIVRGRTVSCSTSGQDDGGRVRARCVIDGAIDVSSELVRNGYAFATSSLFHSLSSDEEEARTAKAGIWQGEVTRPQEWRDQAWEEAKREAPDGCPIKGILRASTKLYALPWSDGYARARVRTERGERWFCSEDEAKAAGFSPSSRS